MARFIVQRLAIIPLVLALANFLGYAYAFLARLLNASNPFFATQAGSGSLLSTYTDYLRSLLRLDLGTLPDSQVPITAALVKASTASLGLLVLALLCSVLMGLAVGIAAVRTEPPRIAPWMTVFTTIGLALPSFFIGSLCIAVIVVYLIWGPGPPTPLPIQGFGWDRHLVLPTLALMLRPTAQIAQVTAGLLVDELGKPYIIAARSRGISWRTVVRRHALRPIVAPVLQTIGSSVRLLAGELVIVEWLFYWPGLGQLVARTLIPAEIAGVSGPVSSPLFLNPPLVATELMLLAGLFVVTDGIAAILARACDPRLRMAWEAL